MKKHVRSIGAIALAMAMAGSAQAVPLSDLFGGGSITAGDKLFDQWQLSLQDTSIFVDDPDFALIDVTSLHDGGDDPGPGINIDFGGQMTVEGDDIFAFSDLTIDFRVSTVGDKLIKDNSLTFGSPASILAWFPDAFNDLGMTVEEWVYDAAGNELAHKYIEFSILDDVQTSLFPDTADFAPQEEIFVTKSFFVWSTDVGDTATLGGVEQRFSQIPEPATLALLSLGLVGFGIGRRRRA